MSSMDAVASKDKRVKREIANSNERRRMQSINAGFQKLKRLLPVKDGEKISKANILQHAADYIQKIQQERLQFYEDNAISIMKRENITAIASNKDGCSNEFTNNNFKNANNPDTSSNNNNNNNKDKNTIDSNNSTSNNNTRDRNSTRTRVRTKKSTRNKNNSLDEFNNNIIINNNTNNLNNLDGVADRSISHELTSQYAPVGSVAEIISDKVTSPKDGMAKAAIALPLEVPYTIELNPNHQQQHHHHQNPGAGSKGQNLDIICKAIMEIEGVATSKLTTL